MIEKLEVYLKCKWPHICEFFWGWWWGGAIDQASIVRELYG